MTATARKEAMRGSGAPPSDEIPEDSQEDGLTAEDLAEFDESSDPPDEELPDEIEDENPLDKLPLPPHVEEDERGDWVYTLQHPANGHVPFKKIRIPKNIYAKDIRRSTQGRNDGETVFFMLCSVSKIPAKLMDKIDAKDYAILSLIMQRRALGNSRAVLRSIGGVDGETESSPDSPPTGE